MTRILCIATLAFLSAFPLRAQDDQRLSEQQADRMHTFAKLALGKGFPRQAKLIWLQALKLYDAEHEETRKALGYVRQGRTWVLDPSHEFPTEDTGSGADGQMLFKRYETLMKELAAAHRSQAKKWSGSDRKDKTDYHFGMILRWVKDDSEAQAALNHQPIGDLTGSTLEQTLYERSKMIEGEVVAQTGVSYPTQLVESGGEHPFLEKAQVEYSTVTSEHFTLHGDHEIELMQGALEWAERALRVLQVALPAEGGFNADPKRWLRGWAFFKDADTYKQVLRANANLVPDLAWVLENSSASNIVSREGALRVGATSNRQLLFDATVRRVAVSYSGFRSGGLTEGIGHTFVGMMFNNNRLFAIDLKRQQGTTASEKDREYTSPDFDVWKNLALEQAWKITDGVEASTLPIITIATFTNEQRIKAWSFCDYMVRRDPKVLLDLDRLSQERTKSAVEQEFSDNHGFSLASLDKGWEDFWTGASPVMKAIKSETPPLAAVSRNVTQWLEAFNAARAQQGATPVAWSASYSTRAHDHTQYLKLNKKERGLDQIQRQDPELEGGSHLGNMFAQMAVVSTSARLSSAKKMFQNWLGIPGYRDALVHDFLLVVGLHAEGSTLVMNVTGGLGTPKSKRSGYTSYPRMNMKGIPREVPVADLGPEFKELLAKNGHPSLKIVGYPLTLHFGRHVQGNRSSYRCQVSIRGDEVPGMLVMEDATNRRIAAPGMVTFYPLQPLKSGVVEVVWTWEQSNGPQRLSASFTTK